MEINKNYGAQSMGNLKGFKKAGAEGASFANISDSFQRGGKPEKQADLKKAASVLFKKNIKDIDFDWTVEDKGSPSVINDKNVITGGFDAPVRSLDPATGDEKWSSEYKGYVDEGKDGTIYVSTNEKSLVSLDPDSGKENWKMDFDRDVRVISVEDDGTIYAKSAVDFMVIDSKEQKVKWKCRAMGYPQIGKDNNVYVSDGYHEVKGVDPSTGKDLWTFQTTGKNQAAPGIGKNGDIYTVDYLGAMNALDPKTGETKWKFDTDSSILQTPLVGEDGTIYVNNCNQNLHAVDPETGKEKWHFTGDGFNSSNARFAPDGSILFSGGDMMYGIDPKNGKKLWEKKAPGHLDGVAMAGKDGRVYFKCKYKNVYSFKTGLIGKTTEEKIADKIESMEEPESNREITKGKGFVDIGGIRLKVNE